MIGIVRKSRNAVLVDTGDMGFWIVTRINDRRVRLFAGGHRDKAERTYAHYVRQED